MQIERFTEEVNVFEEEVKGFSGPHFTKRYRALIMTGQNFQCDLDKLDLSQREDIKLIRKELLQRIDDLVLRVKSKVHDDGKTCENCEVFVV